MAAWAEAIGLAGMILVFASFTVKRWAWLYSLNLGGTILLTLYAYMEGDPIFTIVEAGIAAFLAYRLVDDLRQEGRRREDIGCGRYSR